MKRFVIDYTASTFYPFHQHFFFAYFGPQMRLTQSHTSSQSVPPCGVNMISPCGVNLWFYHVRVIAASAKIIKIIIINPTTLQMLRLILHSKVLRIYIQTDAFKHCLYHGFMVYFSHIIIKSALKVTGQLSIIIIIQYTLNLDLGGREWMCVYIHTHICMCMYIYSIYIYVCICIYVYLYIYIHIYIHINTWIYIYISQVRKNVRFLKCLHFPLPLWTGKYKRLHDKDEIETWTNKANGINFARTLILVREVCSVESGTSELFRHVDTAPQHEGCRWSET